MVLLVSPCSARPLLCSKRLIRVCGGWCGVQVKGDGHPGARRGVVTCGTRLETTELMGLFLVLCGKSPLEGVWKDHSRLLAAARRAVLGHGRSGRGSAGNGGQTWEGVGGLPRGLWLEPHVGGTAQGLPASRGCCCVSRVNLRSGLAADPGGVSAMPCDTTGPGRDPGLSSGPLVFWFASARVLNMSSKLRVSWNWTDVSLVAASEWVSRTRGRGDVFREGACACCSVGFRAVSGCQRSFC